MTLNDDIEAWSKAIREADHRVALVNGLKDIEPEALRRELYTVARRLWPKKAASTVANYMRDALRVCRATGITSLDQLTRDLVVSKWFTATSAEGHVGRSSKTQEVVLDWERIYNHTSGMRTVMRFWFKEKRKE